MVLAIRAERGTSYRQSVARSPLKVKTCYEIWHTRGTQGGATTLLAMARGRVRCWSSRDCSAFNGGSPDGSQWAALHYRLKRHSARCESWVSNTRNLSS
jgi:hypothetical protein